MNPYVSAVLKSPSLSTNTCESTRFSPSTKRTVIPTSEVGILMLPNIKYEKRIPWEINLYFMSIGLRKTWMSQAKKKKKNRRHELSVQIWYQVANATDFYFLSCLFEHVFRGKRKELMGENSKLHSVLLWKWAIQIISFNFLVDVDSDLHIQEGLNFNDHQIHGLIRIYRTI